MSTEVKKQEINNLIQALGHDSLGQSHRSVLASFAQMLAYIEDFEEPKQREVKTLLEAFRGMAEWFYTQYEYSLLMEVQELIKVSDESQRALAKLQKLRMPDVLDQELDRAIQILQNARHEADAKRNALLQRYPGLMQAALDKLRDEWQRLNAIATASSALTQDEMLIRILSSVATAAAISVELKTARILIVPGNVFALYFFSYVENLAVLTVPIYSVRAPWEWSIFWHELAGYKVRQLENDLVINEQRKKLIAFHDAYKTMAPNRQKALLEGVIGRPKSSKSGGGKKNQYSLDYLTTVFSQDQPDLKSFGGFEYQFEQVLAKVTRRKRIQYYELLKAEGWCVDWFKELYEDACSVIAIREPFLTFFQDILSRHPASDQRHPPAKVRLSVAKELLNLIAPDRQIPNKPSPMEKATAEQILRFMSLLMVNSPLVEIPAADQSKVYDYGKIMERLSLYNLPDLVGARIGASIQDWSANLIGGSRLTDSGMDAVQSFEALIESFSTQALDGFVKFSSDELASFIGYLEKEIEIQPSFDKLPADSDYRQLLAFSFYERDFLSSQDIRNVFYNQDGVAAPQPLFNNTANTNFIIDSFGLTVRIVTSSDAGEVTFDLREVKWATTRTNWNNAFPADSPFDNIRQYHIQ